MSDPSDDDLNFPLDVLVDWDDGTTDGRPATLIDRFIVDHLYASAGTYTVAITVTDKDGGVGTTSVEVVVKPRLTIDIKPGSDPNTLNLNGNGVVPVGVLGSDELDVQLLNPETAPFGVTGSEAKPVHAGHIEDLNGDSVADLLLHFREGELGIPPITPGNGELTLTLIIEHAGRPSVTGADVVRIAPNNGNGRDKGAEVQSRPWGETADHRASRLARKHAIGRRLNKRLKVTATRVAVKPCIPGLEFQDHRHAFVQRCHELDGPGRHHGAGLAELVV